jgi:hypothetical protein
MIDKNSSSKAYIEFLKEIVNSIATLRKQLPKELLGKLPTTEEFKQILTDKIIQ